MASWLPAFACPIVVVASMRNISSPTRFGPTKPPVLTTVRVGARPSALAISERSQRVFVVHQGTRGGVSVLDSATGAVMHTVSLGVVTFGLGNNVVASPMGAPVIATDEQTGHVFILSDGTLDRSGAPLGPGTVSMLDATTGRVLRTVRVGIGPAAVVVDARTARVFVVSHGDARLSVLDARTGRVLESVNAGIANPVAVAVDANNHRVFVSGVGDGVAQHAGMAMFDGQSVVHLSIVPLNGVAPTFGVDGRANRLVIGYSVDRYTSYIETRDATTGALIRRVLELGPPSYPLAVDISTGQAILYGTPSYQGSVTFVTVLDTRSGRILHTTRVSQSTYGSALATGAINTVTGHALVATIDTGATQGYVAEIDMRTGRVLRAVMVGQGAPPVVAVDTKSRRVFVLNAYDRSVSVLDAARL